MLEFAQHTFVALACVIVPASFVMWLLALDRRVRGRPLLDLVPRRPVPWSLVDLLLVGLVAFVVLATSQWFCLQQFELPEGSWELSDLSPSQQVNVLATFSVSSLITWLVAMGVCRWRSGASARDLGWDSATWSRDLVLGLGGFVMLIVPVLCIHFVAQSVLPSDETHPFIDLIMEDPRLEYLLPIALAALLAAPLVEEYFFRVLLQGWLERLLARREHSTVTSDAVEGELTDIDEAPSAEADVASSAADVLNPTSLRELAVDTSNPYRSPHVQDAVGADGESPPGVPATPICRSGLPDRPGARGFAIGFSSLAFAMAHFGQGPAPISLFVLALGLGYLYQRTHRVLPCIVVHFLVNLTAVLQLALAILENQT